MNIKAMMEELIRERSRINSALAALELIDNDIAGVATLPAAKPITSAEATPMKCRAVSTKKKQVTAPAKDTEKTCKHCGKGQGDGAEFGKHAAFADGLDNHCKKCRREKYQAKRNPAPTGPIIQKFAQAAEAAPMRVACLTCGEKFVGAKSLGIHKTRVHFGADSEHRRSVQ